MRLASSGSWRIIAILFLAAFWFNIYTGSALAQTLSSKQGLAQCYPVSSVIEEKRGALWKIEGKRIDTKDELIGIDFADSQNGWIASETTAYRTGDGGKHWKRVDFKTPANFTIRKIVFVNASVGWVLLESSQIDPEKKQVWLMHTADAGGSWNVELKQAGAFSRASLLQTKKEAGWSLMFTGTRGDIALQFCRRRIKDKRGRMSRNPCSRC